MKVSLDTNNNELINIIKTITKAYNIKTDIMEFTASSYITLFDVDTIDYNIEKEVIILVCKNIGIKCHIKDITNIFIDKTK